ncbi:hypothetical protein [Lacinutrix undariae]
MRTNNIEVTNTIISVYFILIVLAILSATVFNAFSEVTSNPFLISGIIIVAFIILFVLVYIISKFFEYDSDGVKVVILHRGLLLSEYVNYREYKVEFDKEQLVAFEFTNLLIYKRLTIYVKGRNSSKQKKHSFNISLVSKKKQRYIKQSLSKMIKNNRNNS